MIRRAIFAVLFLASTLAAQTNFYVNSVTGLDSNPGTQAQPWKTFLKANASYTLGAAGTTVHFAGTAGSPQIYLGTPNISCVGTGATPFCVTHGGTATQPVIFQCDNGLNGNAGHLGVPGPCQLRSTSDVANQQFLGTQTANYVTVQGFDIGGDGSHPATLFQGGVLIQPKDGTGNFVQINSNYVHDVASNANDGNGFGNGCTSNTGVGVNGGATTAGTNSQGNKFIGNFINNIGLLSGANYAACNQLHGIYPGGAVNYTIENNIIGNTPGSGIKVYPKACKSIVSNNTVFRAGWWGVLVQDSGTGVCAAKGFTVGQNTIDNNIIVNSGFNNASCGSGISEQTAGTNLYSNNLLIGNQQNVPVQNCTPNPILSVSTFNNANSGATTANTFVNYQNNGTGDYHLKAASIGIQHGTSNCVSGGLTPCIPPTDFSGVVRPSGGVQDIGAYVFTSTGVPIVTFSPSPLAFGTVAVSSSSVLTSNLTNTGTASLTVTAKSITGTNPADFTETDNCGALPFTLTAGSFCALTVTFTPQASGARSANVTITDNASGSPHQLPLTGTGGIPSVSFSPPSLAFGTIAPNPAGTSCSAVQTYQVNSTGTSDLTQTLSQITGTNATDFQFGGTGTCHQPQSYPPGTSCLISVKFCPLTAGAKTANVALSTNVTGSPQLEPLSGSGGGSSATLLPASFNYGTQQVGTSSPAHNFTFTNTGSLALNGVNVLLGGGPYNQTNNCPASLPVGNNCAVAAVFSPTATGTFNSTITMPVFNGVVFNWNPVTNATSYNLKRSTVSGSGYTTIASISAPTTTYVDAPTGGTTFFYVVTDVVAGVESAPSTQLTVVLPTVQSSLSGTGGAPSIVLSSSSVNFGNVLIGSFGTASITVTNQGTVAATISGISTAAPFSQTNTCPTSLAAQAVCTINLTATPTVLGLATGSIVVADNAPGNPHSAALSVTGVAPVASFNPTSFNFGNQPVGTQGAFTSFAFTNGGTGSMLIYAVGLTGTNPGDYVIGANTCGAAPTLADTFSTGTLDATKWAIDTGNSPAPGSNNTGTFSASNVSLSQGMLDLVLTQVAGTPIISTGAEVRSVNTFGYGTYSWTARAGSTSATPNGAGSAVSGQVTGLFNYFQNNGLTAPNFTEDDFEIEGQFPTQLEMTSWSSASPVVNTETNFTASGMDTAFHQYTYVWQPGRIDYYFDGGLVSTHTTNVPTSPAFIIQNFYGTNGTAFGGTATTGVTRHLYLKSFTYTPSNTSLGPGQSCSVQVAFKPTSNGTRTANLSITDSASGSPHTAALTGNGTTLTVTLLPSPLTFPSTTVGVTSSPLAATLTNTGNIDLHISNKAATGDYAISSSSCGATLTSGANCAINVTFTPTATGTRTGALSVTDDANGSPQSIPLTGTGTAPTAPIVSLSTTLLAFGNQVINTTSSTLPVILNNIGNATLSMTRTISGDFAISSTTCGATVAAGGNCQVNVSFTPTATGSRLGQLTFTDNAAGSPHIVSLTGTGTSPTAPAVTLSPTSLTFGGTFVGSSSPTQDVTLTNSGNATLNISLLVATGDYSRTTTCGATVLALANCVIHVTFTPTASGVRAGAISITDDAPGSPQQVPLTGTGIATAPAISVSPTSFNFGSIPVGGTSGSTPFIVTNTGTANLHVSGITPTGPFNETDNCTTVAPQATCTINGKFSPVAPGTVTGQFSIASDAPTSPTLVSLQGFGTTQGFSLTSTAAFGHVTVGSISAPINLILQNIGNVSATVPTPVISGANAGDFSFSTPCTTLAPTATCTIAVVFAPTSTGSRTATLTVGTVTSALSGTGDALVPTLTLAPTAIDFGNVQQFTVSPSQSIQLTNTSNTTLTITSVLPTGANAADMTVTNHCGATVAAGGVCTADVTCTPSIVGSETAAVTFTTNAASSPDSTTLACKGTAVPTPSATFNPSTTIAFGNVKTNTTSAAKIETVGNIGNANLNVSSVTLGGANPSQYSQTNNCSTVTPNTSCAVTVNCTPSSTGSKPATLVIASNDPTTPSKTINLTCTGKGRPHAVIGVSSIDFGNTTVGTTSTALSFTVTNTGDDTLNVSDISTAGDTFPQNNTCTCCPVAPGTSCLVNVQFSPQLLCGQYAPDGITCISDVHQGSLTVTSDADNGPNLVALAGTAVPIPPPPGPIRVIMGGKLKIGGHLKVGVQ